MRDFQIVDNYSHRMSVIPIFGLGSEQRRTEAVVTGACASTGDLFE